MNNAMDNPLLVFVLSLLGPSSFRVGVNWR